MKMFTEIKPQEKQMRPDFLQKKSKNDTRKKILS